QKRQVGFTAIFTRRVSGDGSLTEGGARYPSLALRSRRRSLACASGLCEDPSLTQRVGNREGSAKEKCGFGRAKRFSARCGQTHDVGRKAGRDANKRYDGEAVFDPASACADPFCRAALRLIAS